MRSVGHRSRRGVGRSLHVFAIVVIVLSWGDGSFGQVREPHVAVGPDDAAVRSALGLSFEEFERWVKKTRAEHHDRKEPPALAGAAVRERLRAGLRTTEGSILCAVNAWNKYASDADLQPGQQNKRHFFATIAYIDEILPLIGDKKFLSARLHMRKAGLYRLEPNRDKTEAELRESLRILQSLRLEVTGLASTPLYSLEPRSTPEGTRRRRMQSTWKCCHTPSGP